MIPVTVPASKNANQIPINANLHVLITDDIFTAVSFSVGYDLIIFIRRIFSAESHSALRDIKTTACLKRTDLRSLKIAFEINDCNMPKARIKIKSHM